MIRAVIFDCFGVLVGRGFEETYRIAGGDPKLDRKFIDDILGQANMGMISDGEFHDAMTGQLGITMQEWRKAVTEAEQPNEELLEYIEELHKNFKTAVLSNANVGVVERRLGHDRIKGLFDALIVSADVGYIKPEAEIYRYTAERLGVETNECIFVDDKDIFLQAAETLGMSTVLYQDFEQARADINKLLDDSKS